MSLSIFYKLPDDILDQVCLHLRPDFTKRREVDEFGYKNTETLLEDSERQALHTLMALSQTSKRLRHIAVPHLWRDVSVKLGYDWRRYLRNKAQWIRSVWLQLSLHDHRMWFYQDSDWQDLTRMLPRSHIVVERFSAASSTSERVSSRDIGLARIGFQVRLVAGREGLQQTSANGIFLYPSAMWLSAEEGADPLAPGLFRQGSLWKIHSNICSFRHISPCLFWIPPPRGRVIPPRKADVSWRGRDARNMSKIVADLSTEIEEMVTRVKIPEDYRMKPWIGHIKLAFTVLGASMDILAQDDTGVLNLRAALDKLRQATNAEALTLWLHVGSDPGPGIMLKLNTAELAIQDSVRVWS